MLWWWIRNSVNLQMVISAKLLLVKQSNFISRISETWSSETHSPLCEGKLFSPSPHISNCPQMGDWSPLSVMLRAQHLSRLFADYKSITMVASSSLVRESPWSWVSVFVLVNFYWHTVDLQCCVPFCCTANWTSHAHT